MTRKWIGVMLALALAATVGCGGGSDGDDPAASYRTAIPPESAVTSAELQPPAGRILADVGDPAIYPWYGVPVAWAVNGVVVGHFALMRLLVALPPAYFDPVDQVMAWGPFPNAEGGDIAVFIVRNADYDPLDETSFEFMYQFLRIPEGWEQPDGSEAAVVMGASKPNDPGGPNGVFLINFNANAAFPGDVKETHTLGGFAAAWAQMPVPASETDTGGVLTAVLAVFRDFVPEETPPPDPVNVDYLYGHFAMADASSTTLDFLEFKTMENFNGTAGNELDELLDVRMAFLNGKQGRAEVGITGGDVTGILTGIECWGDDFRRQYLMMTDGVNPPVVEGEPAYAGPIFSQSLDALKIPSIKSITDDKDTILPLLSAFATCGAQSCN